MKSILKLAQLGVTKKKFLKIEAIDKNRLEFLWATGEEPTLSELKKITKSLKISMQNLADDESQGHLNVLFRDTMGKTKINFQAVANVSNFVSGVQEVVKGESVSWLNIFQGKFSQNDPELDSRLFRKFFLNDDMYSPLHNLPEIIGERLKVALFPVKSDLFDGASLAINGFPYVFVSARFKPRMLFTLAHEVGHLVSHHDLSKDFGFVDEDVESNKITTEQERYADEFASCLLMPQESVGMTISHIRKVHDIPLNSPVGDIEICFLSRIYGVSFIVAGLRCEKLKLLPNGGTYSLYKEINEKFGSPEKRADELGLPARPEIKFSNVPKFVLDKSIEAIRDGEVSIGRVSNLLGVSISKIFGSGIESA